MDKGAQEYLMALEKARLRAVERGGAEAGTRLIEGQKKKAAYLAGDDDKARTVRAARTRLKNKTDKAAGMFESQSRAQNNSYVPNNAQFTTGAKPEPKLSGRLNIDAARVAAARKREENKKKDEPKKDKPKLSVYEARQRAANGARN